MAPKPLAEVLAMILVRERYRLDPKNTQPWENLSDERRNVELGSMAEVVRTFKGFGLELANDGGNIVLRKIPKLPKKVGAKVAKRTDLNPTGMSNPQPPRFALLQAKQSGYEGDSCDNCGAMMMVRNGSCLKCMSCGTTTGCS